MRPIIEKDDVAVKELIWEVKQRDSPTLEAKK